MRVAIYSRVSTKKQDEMNQLLQLREFVTRQNGWTIEAEYVDKVSGSGKKERKAFDKMLLDASQRKFDLLLFWALDRLSREGIVRTIGYLEQLKGWNVGWRSYTQPFLDTGNSMVNDIVLSVLAAVAKQERITISERTLAGLQRARQAGKVLGRRPVRVDVALARRMQREGLGLRPIAKALKVSVNTLRGALAADAMEKASGSSWRTPQVWHR
jgi:DNA invertase Pin-like site-specific DNA recombinase